MKLQKRPDKSTKHQIKACRVILTALTHAILKAQKSTSKMWWSFGLLLGPPTATLKSVQTAKWPPASESRFISSSSSSSVARPWQPCAWQTWPSCPVWSASSVYRKNLVTNAHYFLLLLFLTYLVLFGILLGLIVTRRGSLVLWQNPSKVLPSVGLHIYPPGNNMF